MRDRILAACRKNGVAQGCTEQNIVARIDEGVRVVARHSEAAAIRGRAHQGREMVRGCIEMALPSGNVARS